MLRIERGFVEVSMDMVYLPHDEELEVVGSDAAEFEMWDRSLWDGSLWDGALFSTPQLEQDDVLGPQQMAPRQVVSRQAARSLHDVIYIFSSSGFGDEALRIISASACYRKDDELLRRTCNDLVSFVKVPRGVAVTFNWRQPAVPIRFSHLSRLLTSGARPENPSVTRLLACSNLNANLTGCGGISALMWCVAFHNTGMLALLLKRPDVWVNYQQQGGAGYSAAMLACKKVRIPARYAGLPMLTKALTSDFPLPPHRASPTASV